jgi:hypothetical protein
VPLRQFEPVLGGLHHLEAADAEAWCNYLPIGDQVQVVMAYEEIAVRRQAAAHAPPAEGSDTSGDAGGGDTGGGNGGADN